MPIGLPLSDVRVADVLTTGEAARRLECSQVWVRHLIASGRLPAASTPLGHLIPRDAVERLALERAERAGGGHAA